MSTPKYASLLLIIAWPQILCAEALNPEMIGLIEKTAKSICELPLQSSTESIKAKGKIKVEVDSLLKRLIDAGAELDADVDYTKRLSGILEQDLPIALNDVNQCRQNIFNRLMDAYFPPEKPITMFYPKWRGHQAKFQGPKNGEDLNSYMKAERLHVKSIQSMCGNCVVITEHTNVVPPSSNARGFTIAKLAPGSYIDFDAASCTQGIRYELYSQDMYNDSGITLIRSVVAILDLGAGHKRRVEVSGAQGLWWKPVECLI